MDPQPSPALRRYALLGDPVAHSRSPSIHNAAFAAAGVAASYAAIRVAPGQLIPQLRLLAEAGGGGNVTVPYKQLALAAVDIPSPAVLSTGAVNTFWGGPQGVHGDNTDVIGFRDALAYHSLDLAGRQVLVLGAGGAAAAVLLVLLQAGSRVTLVNRSAERGRALAERLAPAGPVRLASAPPGAEFAAVVNATSLGMRPGDPHPLAVNRLPPHAAVVDLVYAPGETAWVRAARAGGHLSFDGSEMLLRQAAAAFSLWTGLPAPLEVMRRALTAPR